MPASRSRTERWRDCLDQIRQRGGSLEFSVSQAAIENAGAAGGGRGADLIWRVRLLSLSDTEIIVEQPVALTQPLFIDAGVELIGVMSIGQNRWMFRTRSLAATPRLNRPGVLRLAMPASIERVQRRQFYRVSTADLSLPVVECWPLLNPTTVGAAEVANRAQVEEAVRTGTLPSEDALVLPEVGPKFNARLLNVGGGGVGLMIDAADARAVDRARLFWVRLDLRPHVPVPVGATLRIAHHHTDSTQAVYAGLSFEFSFNPSNQAFVVGQMMNYVAAIQQAQQTAGHGQAST